MSQQVPETALAPADLVDKRLCHGTDGCGGTFPRKSTHGLCGRCGVVKDLEDNGRLERAEGVKVRNLSLYGLADTY